MPDEDFNKSLRVHMEKIKEEWQRAERARVRRELLAEVGRLEDRALAQAIIAESGVFGYERSAWSGLRAALDRICPEEG